MISNDAEPGGFEYRVPRSSLSAKKMSGSLEHVGSFILDLHIGRAMSSDSEMTKKGRKLEEKK